MTGSMTMGIAIRCAACGRSLRAADELTGKRVKCPDCGAVIRVAPPIDELEVLDDDATVGEDLGGAGRSAPATRHHHDSSLIFDLRPGATPSEKLRRSNSRTTPLLL